jgi:DNA-directed RNA polymerase subunit F
MVDMFFTKKEEDVKMMSDNQREAIERLLADTKEKRLYGHMNWHEASELITELITIKESKMPMTTLQENYVYDIIRFGISPHTPTNKAQASNLITKFKDEIVKFRGRCTRKQCKYLVTLFKASSEEEALKIALSVSLLSAEQASELIELLLAEGGRKFSDEYAVKIASGQITAENVDDL